MAQFQRRISERAQLPQTCWLRVLRAEIWQPVVKASFRAAQSFSPVMKTTPISRWQAICGVEALSLLKISGSKELQVHYLPEEATRLYGLEIGCSCGAEIV